MSAAPRPAPASPSGPGLMSAQDWGFLVFLSLLWGGSFFFNQVALRDLPVLTLVAARLGLAALILGLVLRLRGERLPRGGEAVRALVVMGILNNALPFSLIVWGQSHVGSGVAAILNASAPLFTVLFAHWLTPDERLTPARLAGVVTGLAGVAVMMGSGGSAGSALGALPGIAAAICYALAAIWGRRFRRLEITPLATATGQCAISALLLLPFALSLDRPWTLPPPGFATIAAMLGLAALSTALAYVVFFRLLSTAGATNLILVTFLVPVSAILLAVVVLGETILPRHIAGMALIAAGLALIDGRILKRR